MIFLRGSNALGSPNLSLVHLACQSVAQSHSFFARLNHLHRSWGGIAAVTLCTTRDFYCPIMPNPQLHVRHEQKATPRIHCWMQILVRSNANHLDMMASCETHRNKLLLNFLDVEDMAFPDFFNFHRKSLSWATMLRAALVLPCIGPRSKHEYQVDVATLKNQ